uniref:Uncharacterized protein n=2 Tax=Arundo donax TaxID=35708 RepID=A0A0A9FCZ4_ARUDO
MTWNTARWRYWMNFQVKRPAQMESQRSMTQTRFQLSSRKYWARRYQRRSGLGSGVGRRLWLSIWLRLRLLVVPMRTDWLGACSSSVSRL